MSAAICLCFASSALANISDSSQIRPAKPIINAYVHFDDSHVGTLTQTQQLVLARTLAQDVLQYVDDRPDRIITIRITGTYLAYDRFNHNRRRHYRNAFGAGEETTRQAHELAMNRIISEIIRETKRLRPGTRVACFGLPVEFDDRQTEPAAVINDRFTQAINLLDAFVTDITLQSTEADEFDDLVAATPQAHARRGERPILFRNNDQWRIAYARDIDENDHYDGRGFGNFPGEIGSSGNSNNSTEPLFYWAGTGLTDDINLDREPLIEDRVLVFYEYLFGLYPKFEDGIAVNGGIPQLAKLQGHLDKVAADLDIAIPDENWDGFGVIDFEAWELVWDRTPEIYQVHSRLLVQTRYPWMGDEQVEIMAEIEYEAAARTFMEETIRECQRLRPETLWGFWGLGRNWQEQYPQYDWVWQISDAFYPSLYCIYYSVPDDTHDDDLGPYQQRAEEYRLRVFRYKRFIDLFAGDRPVIAFGWRNYSTGLYNWTEINDLDMEMLVHEWWLNGYDGLALWDHLRDQDDVDAFNECYENRLGPMIESMRDDF